MFPIGRDTWISSRIIKSFEKMPRQAIALAKSTGKMSVSGHGRNVEEVIFKTLELKRRRYPLTNIYITMEKDPCLWMNQLYLWPYSIAMLNYHQIWRIFFGDESWLKTSTIKVDGTMDEFAMVIFGDYPPMFDFSIVQWCIIWTRKKSRPQLSSLLWFLEFWCGTTCSMRMSYTCLFRGVNTALSFLGIWKQFLYQVG